jgi:hypothetical protein
LPGGAETETAQAPESRAQPAPPAGGYPSARYVHWRRRRSIQKARKLPGYQPVRTWRDDIADLAD